MDNPKSMKVWAKYRYSFDEKKTNILFDIKKFPTLKLCSKYIPQLKPKSKTSSSKLFTFRYSSDLNYKPLINKCDKFYSNIKSYMDRLLINPKHKALQYNKKDCRIPLIVKIIDNHKKRLQLNTDIKKNKDLFKHRLRVIQETPLIQSKIVSGYNHSNLRDKKLTKNKMIEWKNIHLKINGFKSHKNPIIKPMKTEYAICLHTTDNYRTMNKTSLRDLNPKKITDPNRYKRTQEWKSARISKSINTISKEINNKRNLIEDNEWEISPW